MLYEILHIHVGTCVLVNRYRLQNKVNLIVALWWWGEGVGWGGAKPLRSQLREGIANFSSCQLIFQAVSQSLQHPRCADQSGN